jgi:putative PIN family toxin of toxin-antitoxin system
MAKIVIDTNIIISAVLSPTGNPATILKLLSTNEGIKLFYSMGILDEYRRVLSYTRLNIADDKQSRAIGLIEKFGMLVEPTVSTLPLPDESDRIFYDTAKSSDAILITGNIKHFPNEPFIMTPSDFLKKIE